MPDFLAFAGLFRRPGPVLNTAGNHGIAIFLPFYPHPVNGFFALHKSGLNARKGGQTLLIYLCYLELKRRKNDNTQAFAEVPVLRGFINKKFGPAIGSNL
ncbi:MAG: hypothetical protein KA155_07580 [Alphaproteobacteria bacterium]|jgi:hypothetical protein|nr:hypothetical protein [Alphaproteobacteria bacterium]